MTDAERHELQELEAWEAEQQRSEGRQREEDRRDGQQLAIRIERILIQYYGEILLTWLTRFGDIPVPLECAVSDEYAAGYRFARQQMADLIKAESYKEASDQGTASRHAKEIKAAHPEIHRPYQPSRTVDLKLDL